MNLLNGKGNQMLISQRSGYYSTNSMLIWILTCGFHYLQNGNGTLSRAVRELVISTQMDLCKLCVRLLGSWALQVRLDPHLEATEQFIWLT